MPSQLRALTDLTGPAGRLEALLNTGEEDCPYAALIAHPHPLFGGTMHNKVVYHAMKAFTACGVPVLRFNFRGVGLSEGTHAHGVGEIDDVRAALDWLTREYARPILFAGFSFGSYVGLRACCPDEKPDSRVAGLIALGAPVQAAGRSYTWDFLQHCTRPKLFVSGDHDEFCPTPALDRILAETPKPWQRDIVAGADHFFQGIPTSPAPKLEIMQTHIRHWLRQTYLLPNPPSSASPS